MALITYKEGEDIPLQGTGSHGMYFKINGKATHARGANVVPASQLEGRLTDEGHKILVESAAAANMNMLRGRILSSLNNLLLCFFLLV